MIITDYIYPAVLNVKSATCRSRLLFRHLPEQVTYFSELDSTSHNTIIFARYIYKSPSNVRHVQTHFTTEK